ncbi:MAG: hypothetical protein IJN20_05720 [Oscillospiraceae bacterium]|nr:hypothetical protein [Oscillospiraceae bacterium]
MRKWKKQLLCFVLSIAALVGLVYLRDFLKEKDEAAEMQSSNGRQYAPFVDKADPMYQFYVAAHPEQEIILASIGDITDDGVDELVVIYRANADGACETVVLVNENGNYYETTPTPAPRENQKMRFFNMDKKDVMELLITGSKDGEVGYAIYRIIDRELINFFGEGMEDCC